MDMACEPQTRELSVWLPSDDFCSGDLSTDVANFLAGGAEDTHSSLLPRKLTYLDAYKTSPYGESAFIGPISEIRVAARGYARSTQSLARILRQPIRVYGYLLPRELAGIAKRISASHSMLDLEEGWDDLGSPTYKQETWLSATLFVVNASSEYWEKTDKVPALPAILRGSHGDIDIIWRSGSRSLLINIPASEDSVPTFLGTDGQNPVREISGSLDVGDGNGWILEWLNQ